MTYVVVVTANGIEERDVEHERGHAVRRRPRRVPFHVLRGVGQQPYSCSAAETSRKAPRRFRDVLLPAPSFRRDAGPFTGPLVFVRMDVACNPVDYRAADYERLRSEGHAAVDDDANE